MKQKWRYIPDLEASGKLQMAIDTWLLKQHQQGKILPTLRFYTWLPVAISLGYHQRHYPEMWHQLQWQYQPLDIIRRPTGGRAVLHQGDLTYAIVTSHLQGNRLQTYQTLCQFLIKGWQELGFSLGYGETQRGYIHHPSCFTTATGADLILENGYKLIGSAQLRKGKAILQHGSMRLFPDAQFSTQIFPDSQPMLEQLQQISDQNKFKQIVIETLIQSAQDCFEIDLMPQPLSKEEWTEIKQLIINN